MMNDTTLALVAVLAAAVVIGTFASPAFGYDSRKTITKRYHNKQTSL